MCVRSRNVLGKATQIGKIYRSIWLQFSNAKYEDCRFSWQHSRRVVRFASRSGSPGDQSAEYFLVRRFGYIDGRMIQSDLSKVAAELS